MTQEGDCVWTSDTRTQTTVSPKKPSTGGSSAGLHAGQEGIVAGRMVKCWIRRSVRPAADYGHISRDSV